MLRTKNTLPEEVRTQIAELCALRLSEAVDLQLQAKQAHWTVRGPHFGPLHELFDEIAGAVGGYADLVAERAAQLGGTVDGTAKGVAARSTLPGYPANEATGAGHIEAFGTALAAFGALTRNAIATALALGDQATADIFIEITRGVDVWLWKVEAHQQAPR